MLLFFNILIIRFCKNTIHSRWLDIYFVYIKDLAGLLLMIKAFNSNLLSHGDLIRIKVVH